MSKKFCLIYYYVPEDKDDPEFPNAFGVNLSQEEVRLSDIKSMFPLEGEYIFRFKYKLNNATVWMDITDDSKLPLFNGKIYMKATRICWEKKHTSHKVKEDRHAANIEHTKSEPSKHTSQQNQGFSIDDANLLGGLGKSAPKNENLMEEKKPTNAYEDFNLLATPQPKDTQKAFGQAPTQKNNINSNDLLDFSDSGSYNKPSQSNKNDLLNFDKLF